MKRATTDPTEFLRGKLIDAYATLTLLTGCLREMPDAEIRELTDRVLADLDALGPDDDASAVAAVVAKTLRTIADRLD